MLRIARKILHPPAIPVHNFYKTWLIPFSNLFFLQYNTISFICQPHKLQFLQKIRVTITESLGMNCGIPTTGIITAGSMLITLISIKRQK